MWKRSQFVRRINNKFGQTRGRGRAFTCPLWLHQVQFLEDRLQLFDLPYMQMVDLTVFEAKLHQNSPSESFM